MSQVTKQKTKLSAHKIRQKSVHTAKNANSLSTSELAALAMASGSFDWLSDPSEDIYSRKDGKEAAWPTKRTNGAA